MGERLLTTSKNRIVTIDALRGFALAGILYAHMIIWYTGAALPPGVYTNYDSTADGIAFGIFGALVLGKFFSIFSFLFGLSFFLYFQKREAMPHYQLIYIWRLFLLFLIGVFHHILWRGDILAIYAVLGTVMMLFRNLPLRSILFLALLLITGLPNHLYEAFNAGILNVQVELPMAEEAENYYNQVKGEGFFSVLRENWRSWPAKIQYQLESGRILMTFGYFLLGLYAGRIRLFSAMDENISKFLRWNRVTRNAVLVLLFLGLLMYLFDLVTIPGIKVVPEFQWLANVLFSLYNTCLTVFYITGVTLLFQKKAFYFLLKPLAIMGRMALTNYLLQTLFGLLLFYHFGLGLFDKTTPAINVVLGLVVFILQLKFSKRWLQHFNQGPVEWIWRGATYFNFSSNIKNRKY